MAIPRFFTSKEVILPSGLQAASSTCVICDDDRLQTMSLEDALAAPSGFAALDAVARVHDRRPAAVRAWQTAVRNETIVITVPPGVRLMNVVQVISNVTAQSARRLIIVMGEGSRASFSIKTLLAAGVSQKGQSLLGHTSGGLLADSVEMVLGAGAVLEVRRLVSGEGSLFSMASAIVGTEAHLAWSDFHAGDGFRQALSEFAMRGRAATVRYRSGAIGTGSLKLDEACRAASFAADTKADVRSWAVVTKGDRVVSGGRVTMHHSAPGASGHQRTHGLLLERGAEFIAQPDLEAEHDTVSGGHGAAISGLEPESLFYLQSRGLDGATARRTLAAAFLGEAVDAFTGSGLELPLSAIIEQSLA